MIDEVVTEEYSGPDSFSAYAAAIDRVRRDTKEAQAKLLRTAKGIEYATALESRAAYQELWQQASKLVLYIHARMKRSGKLPTVGYDDLDAIQEANIAVGEALLKWDPERGTLATWLVPHIRGALLNYANTHLNAGIGSKHVNVVRVGLDEQVDSEEISSAQDEPGQEQSIGITREESLTYGDAVPQLECLQRAQVERAIESMPYRNRVIASLHYLGGLSVTEIAERHGVSGETVRRSLHESNVWLRNKLWGIRR
jgi:RNA polymerase sigma factor (sigma-70 family)